MDILSKALFSLWHDNLLEESHCAHTPRPGSSRPCVGRLICGRSTQGCPVRERFGERGDRILSQPSYDDLTQVAGSICTRLLFSPRCRIYLLRRGPLQYRIVDRVTSSRMDHNATRARGNFDGVGDSFAFHPGSTTGLRFLAKCYGYL